MPPPDLHIDPDRLHVDGLLAVELAEELRAAVPAGYDLDLADAERERIGAAVRAAATELAELGAALTGVAEVVTAADAEAARTLGRVFGARP